MAPIDPDQPAAPGSPGAAHPRSGRSPSVIGLLGGIASGKSTVAGEFARHGFKVVDADQVARDVVGDPVVLAELVARFGSGILTTAGDLDRGALADRAFADPQSRADLDKITHPPIRARLLALLAEHRAAGHDVVLDVPLLMESGYLEMCEGTVFLEVPEAIREARARARGWAEGERARREAHQESLAAKRDAATWVVENGNDRGSMSRQVAAIAAGLRPST